MCLELMSVPLATATRHAASHKNFEVKTCTATTCVCTAANLKATQMEAVLQPSMLILEIPQNSTDWSIQLFGPQSFSLGVFQTSRKVGWGQCWSMDVADELKANVAGLLTPEAAAAESGTEGLLPLHSGRRERLEGSHSLVGVNCSKFRCHRASCVETASRQLYRPSPPWAPFQCFEDLWAVGRQLCDLSFGRLGEDLDAMPAELLLQEVGAGVRQAV